jgi:hypothetical protein
MRANIVALVEEPPNSNENGKSTSDQARVVHGLRIGGKCVREAEDDDEGDDIDATQNVDNVADDPLHPEVPWSDQGTTRENVWEDSSEVRESRELDVGADEGVEGRCRAYVDAGQDGDHETTDQCRIEGIVHAVVDSTKETRKGGRVVARKCPQCPTSGDIASNTRYQGRKEGHNQQSQGTTTSTRSLAINFCQRESKNTVDHGIEVLNGVEHGNHVQQARQETNDHLCENGLGNVSAGTADWSTVHERITSENRLTLEFPRPNEMSRREFRRCRRH